MKKKNRMKNLSSADYKKIISGFRNDFLLCYTTRRLLLKDEKMKQYKDLCRHVLEHGEKRETGQGPEQSAPSGIK